jgi:lipopolysaccharide export system permease protein
MTTLGRYYLRRIVPPFLVALTVVLMALSLERLLRIVEEITDNGAPVGQAFEMLGYLVPHYLELAIPAALFLATMMATRRLAATDELAAMQAAGVPLWRLLRPLLAFSGVVAVLLLLNSGFAQPHARYAYKTRMHEITEATVAMRLQPGVFQRLGERIVVRADEVSNNGRRLRNFFAVVDKADGTRSVITAGRARLRPGQSADLTLELHHGTIVRHGGTQKAGSVTFDTYLWEPPTDVVAPYGPRGADEQQLTIVELMSGDAVDLARNTTPTIVATERHLRLLRPASLPVLALLAVPLGLMGSGRTGRAYGLVLGMILLVLYQKVVGFAEEFAHAGSVAPWLAMWGPFTALLLLASVLTWHRAEASGRDLSTWLRRTWRPPSAPAHPSPAE